MLQRVIAPYIRNLERLGIEARMRIVDLANFEYRMEHFDYDVIVRRYVQPLTPGIEQRGLWSSAYADVVGSRNISGIKNPVIDAMVETVIAAKSRPELVTAARALAVALLASGLALLAPAAAAQASGGGLFASNRGDGHDPVRVGMFIEAVGFKS